MLGDLLRGKRKPELSDVSVSQITDECIKVLSLTGGKKGISVTNSVDGSLMAYSDAVLLSTVLHNLIGNAIKFTHPGGNVTVSAMRNDGFVEIVVSDNGVGMAPDAKEKLFRYDESFSTRGTDHEPGTGLGLLLCREIVDKHGGRIWAESEAGKGTKMHFTLPSAQG